MKLKMTVLKSFLEIQLILQEIITFQQQSPLHAQGSSFSQYQFTNLFMRKFKRLILKYKLQKNTQVYFRYNFSDYFLFLSRDILKSQKEDPNYLLIQHILGLQMIIFNQQSSLIYSIYV
ncbi:unnamed protein product [Paramecium primaurelia]|uniref:Uncharacterized protein n=1 Tax=Paramecium primaurelia TaxID=5886 RepID=A0A8S1QR25_PARPR|nr:unnamed protein product [Paramecium primaurelia]CAD8118009.1 unnamed protein product [Paramecium primaurelia]CAD8118013.1 unnamed protein product [Paramecium primaurelia]CAD8119855.1 unnamed protein product [Paramecium primaurelia]